MSVIYSLHRIKKKINSEAPEFAQMLDPWIHNLWRFITNRWLQTWTSWDKINIIWLQNKNPCLGKFVCLLALNVFWKKMFFYQFIKVFFAISSLKENWTGVSLGYLKPHLKDSNFFLHFFLYFQKWFISKF